jgi:hypothetical protein
MSSAGDTLLALFRGARVQSSVEFWDRQDDKDAAVRRLVDLMEAASQSYAARFATALPGSLPLELSVVEQAYAENQHKLKAFLQALDSTSNPDMLVMVWRILQGDLIKSVDMKYKQENDFVLEITLEDPDTGTISQFRSQDIDDAALVRHFGIMKMSDRPLFDGFYALRT